MRRTLLLTAPPFDVENALKRLGANLRTARLRRNLSLVEVSAKIGVGREAIAEAEHGKPSTSVAVYAALLWAYGLVDQVTEVADPTTDEEGRRLASRRERRNARTPRALDDNFLERRA